MNIHEILNKFEENCRLFHKLLSLLKQKNFGFLPHNSSWDVKEYLEQLADLEDEIIDFRLKKILQEEHPYLPCIRLNNHNRKIMYRNLTLEELIDHILKQRSELLQLLQSLPAENWERTGVHEKEGHVPFKEFVRRMVQKDEGTFLKLNQFIPAT